MLMGSLEQSLIFAIMVLGVYLAFKILHFPDMTVDGSFPLGAAVSARLLMEGVNPYVTLLLALFSGALAGAITGILHSKLKIQDLLTGILVMTALYSVNLRIMGKSNIPLFEVDTIFHDGYSIVWIILFLLCFVKITLDYILKTKFGFILRALGNNENLVLSLGVYEKRYKTYGLMIANALTAFSGAILAQYQGFADIGMGTGTIVIGLASIIIGETLFCGKARMKGTTVVIIGSLIYRGIIALSLTVGLNASDLKLMTSTIVVLVLCLQYYKKRRK